MAARAEAAVEAVGAGPPLRWHELMDLLQCFGRKGLAGEVRRIVFLAALVLFRKMRIRWM